MLIAVVARAQENDQSRFSHRVLEQTQALRSAVDRSTTLQELRTRNSDLAIDALRAGLEDSGEFARFCASELGWCHLDNIDSIRAVHALLPDALSPVGSTNTLSSGLSAVLCSDDIPHIIRLLYPVPAQRDRRLNLGKTHTELARSVHLPIACLYANAESVLCRDAARETIEALLPYTDRYREEVARALVTIGNPDAAASFLNSRTEALRLVLARGIRVEGIYPEVLSAWARRWLMDATAEPASLDVLTQLASHPDPFIRCAALREIGRFPGQAADGVLSTIATDGKTMLWKIAATARRGNADARTHLANTARTSPTALALLFDACPNEAIALGHEFAAGPDADSFLYLLAATEECQGLPGPRLPDSLVRAIIARCSGVALIHALSHVRGMWRRSVAIAACRAFEIASKNDALTKEAWRSAIDTDELDEALGIFEIVAPEKLRSALRAATNSSDNDVSAWAWHTLIALGDPTHGAAIVAWLVAHPEELALLQQTDSIALARSMGESEASWVRSRAPEDFWATCVLSVYEGLPEAFGTQLCKILKTYEGDPPDVVSEFRRNVLSGDTMAAVRRVVEIEPDTLWPNIGFVRDECVTAYLRRLQTFRSSGLYARATAELAVQGDAAARLETMDAMMQGRSAWMASLNSCEATLGYRPDAVGFWLQELESNFDRIQACGAVYSELLRLPETRDLLSLDGIPVRRAWRWHARNSEIQWSRVLDGFVAVPR